MNEEYVWKDVGVVGFDELMQALERADRKGYMPDAVKEAWEGFNWKPAQQEPVAWPIDGDTAKRIADKVCVSYETVQQVARELVAMQPAQQQKPVAIVASHPERIDWLRDEPPDGTLLYTAPPQRKPLTDEQIEREWQFLHDEEGNPPDHHDFARAIEAAHGIGEKK